MAINNSINTNNLPLDIYSNGGAINIGTQVVTTPINIGNNNNDTTVFITAGFGGGYGIQLNSNRSGVRILTNGGTLYMDAQGATVYLNTSNANINVGVGGSGGVFVGGGSGTHQFFTSNAELDLYTGTGLLTISNDATANTIDIATGAGAKTLNLGSTNTTSSVTINTGSGGITVPSFSSYGVVGTDSTGLLSDIAAGTSGYVLTSNGTGSLPSWQPGGGGGGGFTWNNVTGSTQTMVVNNGYVDNGSGAPTVYTLPATANVGDIVAIQGASFTLWQIAQNSGQQIFFNNTATTIGTGGSVSSLDQYDTIYLICITANTGWAYNSGFGSYNVV